MDPNSIPESYKTSITTEENSKLLGFSDETSEDAIEINELNLSSFSLDSWMIPNDFLTSNKDVVVLTFDSENGIGEVIVLMNSTGILEFMVEINKEKYLNQVGLNGLNPDDSHFISRDPCLSDETNCGGIKVYNGNYQPPIGATSTLTATSSYLVKSYSYQNAKTSTPIETNELTLEDEFTFDFFGLSEQAVATEPILEKSSQSHKRDLFPSTTANPVFNPTKTKIVVETSMVGSSTSAALTATETGNLGVQNPTFYSVVRLNVQNLTELSYFTFINSNGTQSVSLNNNVTSSRSYDTNLALSATNVTVNENEDVVNVAVYDNALSTADVTNHFDYMRNTFKFEVNGVLNAPKLGEQWPRVLLSEDINSIMYLETISGNNLYFTYKTNQTPLVYEISSGIGIEGDVINIVGDDLLNSVISIGDIPCEIVSMNLTNIACMIGDGPIGVKEIEVFVPQNGLAIFQNSNARKFLYTNRLVSINPTVASLSGSTLVRIDFTKVTYTNVTVILSGSPCEIKTANATYLECATAPIENTNEIASYPLIKFDGNVPITDCIDCRFSFGMSASARIDSISPAYGKVGDTLSLVGNNFGDAKSDAAVNINGTVCDIGFINNTYIECTLGAHEGNLVF